MIISGSVSNDDAKKIFGTWKEPRPYIRIVPQPQASGGEEVGVICSGSRLSSSGFGRVTVAGASGDSMTATARRFQHVQIDVFTSRPLEGNALAVFTDARGLSDAEMQALARETNLSETTFVFPAGRGHRARARAPRPHLHHPGGTSVRRTSHPGYRDRAARRQRRRSGRARPQRRQDSCPLHHRRRWPGLRRDAAARSRVRPSPRSRGRCPGHRPEAGRHRRRSPHPDRFHRPGLHHRPGAHPRRPCARCAPT